MDNNNIITGVLNWLRALRFPLKVVSIFKDYKKYIIGGLVAITAFLILSTIKTFFAFREATETVKASEYQYFRKTEVESLKSFVKLQTQIDSLQDIKAIKRKEIFEDPKVDIQAKLNLIFNQ